MPYRLIAIDLDGTLLDPDHRLSDANRAAIEACLARGARVLIATGRMFASAGPYVRELGLRGPQITLNGAVLADGETGGLTARGRLAPGLLRTVVATLVEHGLPYTIFGPDAIYAEPGTPHLAVLDGYGEPRAVLLPREELLALPEPAKVLTFLEPSALDAELALRLRGAADVIRTGQRFLEFLSPGVSKGSALEEIMAQYAVPREEVLAIGDSENDLSMFAAAGMSVAMADAADGVRARALATTASCREDGVARALREHALS